MTDSINIIVQDTGVSVSLAEAPGPAISASASANAAAAAAADSAAAASNSESNASASAASASTNAGTATTQAGIATTQAGIATTQAGNASTSASSASASLTSVQNIAKAAPYPVFLDTTAALANGVKSTTGIVGGSSGTDGQFDVSFSGGGATVQATARFTVSGGALTSITVISPGYGYTSAPTMSFAASSGLAGASATAVIGANVAVGNFFYTPSASQNEACNLYRVDAGPTAVPIVTFPSTALVNSQEQRLFDILSASPNFFNKDDAGITDNYFVNNTTGNLQANSSYAASGYVSVTAGETYYIFPKSYLAWFTPTKTFISGSSSSDTSNAQTAPAGAAYLRFSIQKTETLASLLAKAYVTPGSSPLSPYKPYGGLITAPVSRIPSSWIGPANTTFLVRGKNLFDKSARTLDTTQSTGSTVTNTSYDLSDYIPVTEGETYQYHATAGGARFRSCFNSSKVLISAQSTTSETTSYTVPIGSGVAFMRLTINKARVDDFLVELGSTPTFYEAYGYKLTSAILPQEISGVTSKWAGKKCSSFGDSITAQQAWQPAVAAALQFNHTAYGVGGRLVSGASGMCQDAAVNTIPTDTDIVLVLGGTNDWAQSVSLGSVTSSSTSEFYGAYNQMCQKLTTRLPSARIYLLTTTYGELPGRVTDGIWTTSTNNNVGLTTRDYAEAVRVMGKRWGFPVIDFSETGWNEINLTSYMVNDGGWLHPNAAGGARMASVVIGRLKDTEPPA